MWNDLGWTAIRRGGLLFILASLSAGACMTFFKSPIAEDHSNISFAVQVVILVSAMLAMIMAPWLAPRLGWRSELAMLAAILGLCGSIYLYVRAVRATTDPSVVQSCADSFAPNCIPVPPGPSLFPDRHWRRYGHRSH